MTAYGEGVQTPKVAILPDGTEMMDLSYIHRLDARVFVRPGFPRDIVNHMVSLATGESMVDPGDMHGDEARVQRNGKFAIKVGYLPSGERLAHFTFGSAVANYGLSVGLQRIESRVPSVTHLKVKSPRIHAIISPVDDSEAIVPTVCAMDFVDGVHPDKTNQTYLSIEESGLYSAALFECGIGPEDVHPDTYHKNVLMVDSTGAGEPDTLYRLDLRANQFSQLGSL